MTLPPFELHRPRTLDEALELLDRYGEDAVPMHGGTELLLLFKLGLAVYGHVVDLKRVDELREVRVGDGVLHLGGGVTHLEIERAPHVRSGWGSLARMEGTVANLRVRAAGTIGGNLAFSDPHSDPATFLLACGATVVARGPAGERELMLTDFLQGPYQTALRPGELLTSVHVPALPDSARAVHLKLAFRERPAVTVTCVVELAAAGIAAAQVAVGSVGPRPVRAAAAERLLVGLDARDLGADALSAAGEAAAAASGATADANGSADYKRALVATLVGRAVAEACRRS